MTTEPGADERRARLNLMRALDGPPAPARERDWLDDLWDEKPAPPAAPAPEPEAAAEPDGQANPEPGWDFRRLLRWPYARPTVGACAALVPLFAGQSAATWWGGVLTQARTEAGVGAAWVIAATAFGVAAVMVHRRRGWPSYALLTSAFIGTIAMAHPYDIVRFVTGATS